MIYAIDVQCPEKHALLYHGDMKATFIEKTMRLACLKRICSQKKRNVLRLARYLKQADFSNATNFEMLSLCRDNSRPADFKRFQYTVDQCLLFQLVTPN